MTKDKKDKWRNLGRILVGKGLPTIGGAIAGPAGVTIGTVIADIVGASGSDPDKIEEALATASPETLVRLREIDSEILRSNIEAKMNETDNLTKRLESDNQADSWLARNVRPLALVVMVTAYLIYIFIATFGNGECEVTAIEFGEQIKFLLATIVAFYFGSRGTEKVVQTLNNR